MERLELTKEEAVALLCAGLELNYSRRALKERVLCHECELSRYTCAKSLDSGIEKLRTYTEPNLSDAEEDTLP